VNSRIDDFPPAVALSQIEHCRPIESNAWPQGISVSKLAGGRCGAMVGPDPNDRRRKELHLLRA
jgi:hypothetical protein